VNTWNNKKNSIEALSWRIFSLTEPCQEASSFYKTAKKEMITPLILNAGFGNTEYHGHEAG